MGGARGAVRCTRCARRRASAPVPAPRLDAAAVILQLDLDRVPAARGNVLRRVGEQVAALELGDDLRERRRQLGAAADVEGLAAGGRRHLFDERLRKQSWVGVEPAMERSAPPLRVGRSTTFTRGR